MSIGLNCFDCQHRFNLNTREPIIMVCCGKTACRECVTTKMIKNKENADKGLAKKGEFECSGCKSKYYSTVEVDQPILIQFNHMVRDLIA
jgi:hypothetical protein